MSGNDPKDTPDRTTVDRKAFFEVLQALNGPGHLICELQAIRSIQGNENPINALVNQYNASLPPSPGDPGSDATEGPA